MKINSDRLLNDARKLRKSQDEQRTGRTGNGADKANRMQSRLDQMSGNLRTHQQNMAKLQLETISLDQLFNSVQNILEQRAGNSDIDQQNVQSIETTLNAARFQQQQLIPGSIRELLQDSLDSVDRLKTVQDLISKRRQDVSNLLGDELQQINRIQVSFENILSANIPETKNAKPLMDDIKQQLAVQDQLRSQDMSRVDPRSVMQLLQSN